MNNVGVFGLDGRNVGQATEGLSITSSNDKIATVDAAGKSFTITNPRTNATQSFAVQ